MCGFDEGVDAALHLNLDPRKPGQALRTAIELPHGSGRRVKVGVFVDGLTYSRSESKHIFLTK